MRMVSKSLLRYLAALIAGMCCLPVCMAEEEVLDLPLGDPDRRERWEKPVLDAVIDTRTGKVVTPAEAVGLLADVKVLFVSEDHQSAASHRMQERLLELLVASGRKVTIGLEMLPRQAQPHLDAWVAGQLGEEEFLNRSRWYEAWGYRWDYYRDIFFLARDAEVPMVALNVPRQVIRRVRIEGLAALGEDGPSVDVSNQEHRRLFRAYMGEGGHGASDEELEGFYRAQAAWDAFLAERAVTAYKEGPKDGIVVALMGQGHVVYGLGAARQAAQWLPQGVGTWVGVPVAGTDGKATGPVRSSVGDFLWGLPREAWRRYPNLGLSAQDGPEGRRQVWGVLPDSLAEAAGFQVGDVILRVNGQAIVGKEEWQRLKASFAWGDEISFVVRRDEDLVPLSVLLRRQPDI